LIGAGISGYRQFGPSRPPEISVRVKHSASARNAGEPEIHSRLDARSTPECPACGASMVRRVAKKGGNAGEAFWGCTRFPQCRGTRPGW
jgi:restriction system protein